MKHSEVRQGRIFVIRLEDGEILHEALEKFAKEKSIKAAALIIVGGIDAGSRLVTGPLEARAFPRRANGVDSRRPLRGDWLWHHLP